MTGTGYDKAGLRGRPAAGGRLAGVPMSSLGGGDSGGIVCRKCNMPGHYQTQCPNVGPSGKPYNSLSSVATATRKIVTSIEGIDPTRNTVCSQYVRFIFGALWLSIFSVPLYVHSLCFHGTACLRLIIAATVITCMTSMCVNSLHFFPRGSSNHLVLFICL